MKLIALDEQYFQWLVSLVQGERFIRLLGHLHGIQFQPNYPKDENRANDGEELRYRFGEENDISQNHIACTIDTRPCSVLEMMIALAIRIEENFMVDTEKGSQIPIWFWGMVQSLGLQNMEDIYYNPRVVDEIVDDFQNLRYEPNGRGGLFTILDCDRDLRSVEIWYQACWYVDAVLHL